VDFIRGIARRLPRATFDKTEFCSADIGRDPLEPLFKGMDAVIHLGWRIQSAHRPRELELTNVHGSERVFHAVAACRVPTLLYNSSVGAYSEGPKDQPVDESWPADGIPTSLYSAQKARVERLLNELEAHAPGIRVVRFRPALIFKRDAGSEIRRLFVSPWAPRFLFSPAALKIVPYHPRFRFQSVHSFDVGEAFRLALHSTARGAFNLAADPILSSAVLAQAFHARQVPMTAAFMRGVASVTWRMRLQHTDPGWIDLCLGSPLIESTRAREVLGWVPQHSSLASLFELLRGIYDGSGIGTPPLAPPGRVRMSTLRQSRVPARAAE
jgi:nucleoside-diphosphate-sugar epimerase